MTRVSNLAKDDWARSGLCPGPRRRSGPGPHAAGRWSEPSPRSVLFVTPRWRQRRRDRGPCRSQRRRAGAGRASRCMCWPGKPRPGRTDGRGARDALGGARRRAGAGSRAPRRGPLADAEVIHLHQVDDPGDRGGAARRAPVVISAHGYPGCTSGVYYFKPGQSATAATGPAASRTSPAGAATRATRKRCRAPTGVRAAASLRFGGGLRGLIFEGRRSPSGGPMESASGGGPAISRRCPPARVGTRGSPACRVRGPNGALEGTLGS